MERAFYAPAPAALSCCPDEHDWHYSHVFGWECQGCGWRHRGDVVLGAHGHRDVLACILPGQTP